MGRKKLRLAEFIFPVSPKEREPQIVRAQSYDAPSKWSQPISDN